MVDKRTGNLNNISLYALTRKVADIIFEYTAETYVGDKPTMEDRRNQEVNPYYNQTDGLFLELYYGMPSRLWTPWGRWSFGGSGFSSWKKIIPEIIKRFEMTIHQAEIQSNMGVFGPVYALHKVDDTPLPDPIELDRVCYASYEEMKKAWEELTNTFQLGK